MLKKISKYLVFLTILIFPQTVFAQDDLFVLEEGEVEAPKPIYTSEIELGIGWQSQDSFKFGEFSGLTDRGPFFIGNFYISRRDPWDSGGTEYWILEGTNLGLDSRYVGVEYGKQGSFSIFASYDQIPKNLIDDGMTPYIIDSTGTNLTLPAGWVPSDRNISDLTQLNASLQPITISHERQKYGGGFSWQANKHWKFSSQVYHETKEGGRTIAAIFGDSGGDPAGAIVPEPVDYETDTFNFAVEFNNDNSHLALDYNFSNFSNNKQMLTFQNMFSSSRYEDVANFPDGFGRLALPPDNKAHRLTISSTQIINSKTRMAVNFVYNHATQNEAFFPFTVNPDLIVPLPLPRASLMGERDTIMANSNLYSRLTSKLTAEFGFKYEDRDNNTPQDIFPYVPGDVQNQGTLIDEDARINIPYDRTQILAHTTLKYRLSSKVKLTGKYQYESLRRTFSEVAKTQEHSFEGKLQFSPGSRTSGWIGVLYGDRNGTGYIDNFLFIASHTPELLEEEEFENHPLTRKFFIADRERFRLNGAFNWIPGEIVIVSLFGHYTKDDYNRTTLGLLEQKTSSATLDVSITPNDIISYHAYVTYEGLQYDQASLSHRGSDLFNFAGRMWTANTHDKIFTTGFGLDWEAIKDKLKVTGDLTFSDAQTEFFLTGGTAVTFLQLPDLQSKFYAAEVKFDYQFSERIMLRGRYWFQKLDVTDWALDGVDPDTMRFIVGLGNQSPDYNVHILGVSTIVQF